MTSFEKKRTIKNAVALAAVCAILAVVYKYSNVKEYIPQIFNWFQRIGYWGPILFIPFYILTAGIAVPVIPLTIAAGVIFGLAGGFVLVNIAAMASASILFFLGRRFGSRLLPRSVENSRTFKTVNLAIKDGGWKVIALIRFVPVISSIILNYACGMTRLSFHAFFLGTWLGMLPGMLMYVYLGVLIGDVAKVSLANETRTTMEWAMLMVGFLATLIISVYFAVKAKQVLGNDPHLLEDKPVAKDLR